MRPTDSAMRYVPGFDQGWRRYTRGGIRTRAIPSRHFEGACGRGCAPVPNSPCPPYQGGEELGRPPDKGD